MRPLNLAALLAQELVRFAPRYASRCAEHPPLAAYPTFPALVDRLVDPKKNKSHAGQRERAPMLCAVIEAYQKTHDRLWGAILVAAFRPMLEKKRLYGADPEEREAVFFAALTEVVEKLDVRKNPEHVHAIVWRRAKKSLVRKLVRHKAWTEVGFGENAERTQDQASWLPQPLLAAWMLSHAANAATTGAFSDSHPAGAGAEDRPDLDLVIRVAEWGSLAAYVDAEYGALAPAARARVYARLSRRHRRALAELRDAMGISEQAGGSRGSADVVTRDVPPHADMAVTRDRPWRADVAVTRDTLERAACDRPACARSDTSRLDVPDRVLEVLPLQLEVRS